MAVLRSMDRIRYESIMDCSASESREVGQRLTTVDSFRGIAALAVVFAHVQTGISSAGIPITDDVDKSIGAFLLFLLRGSSAYFMIISGFILSSKLPGWKKHPNGLIIRATQRMTKILVIYWIALSILLAINQIRYCLFGTLWVNPTPLGFLSQYLLFSNFISDVKMYIPPGWYLEADFILFVFLIASYFCWSKIEGKVQDRLRPYLFMFTIPLAIVSIYVESLDPFAKSIYAPIRLISYFVLGFLAWHSRKHATALVSLILITFITAVTNDRSRLHEHFVSSYAPILALIFFSSHYSATLTTLTNKPAFQFLFKLNFPLFLFNMFAIAVGLSFVRHFTRTSLVGLVFFLSLSIVVLFFASFYFEKFIQRPVLIWHDKFWKYLLNRTQASTYEITSSRIVVSQRQASLTDSRIHLKPIQPNGR